VNRYDSDLQELDEPERNDREISLGTATILGIFLVLALLCAVFFGFGYSMGRRSAQIVTAPSDTTAASDTGGSKPAPGSPAGRSTPASSSKREIIDEDATDSGSDSPSTVAPTRSSPAVVSKTVALNSRLDASSQPSQPAPSSAVKPVSMPRIAPAAGPGSAIVQIAAVSHQEDADVLVNALKKRGYSVAIRQEPQDKLLHVQIGPFASKKDADAMKQRLLADGYNAIVK
jgi:DedD protein